jgi:hypothetical protein
MSIQKQSDAETTVVVSQDDYVYGGQYDVMWSDHALEQYDLRTPWKSVSPERAWQNGIGAQYATQYFNDGCYPSEVRLYEHENCHSIMIRKDSHIVTVLLLELVSDSAIRSYLHTLCTMYKQIGSGLCSSTSLYGDNEYRYESLESW